MSGINVENYPTFRSTLQLPSSGCNGWAFLQSYTGQAVGGKLSSVSANIAVAIFRVQWLVVFGSLI
jgi:hypothetical protein